MKQQIKRSNLKVIYENVCEDWKNIIKEHLLWNSNDIIEVEDDIILKGYNEADNDQKTLIQKYFKINLPNDLTQIIKTWDDVLKYAGENNIEYVVPYVNPKNKQQKSLNALAKIYLIAEIFNEDWYSDWNNKNESKYYPYFEYKNDDWCFSGVGGHHWYCCRSGSFAHFKSNKIAEYVGKTFIDIYNDYIQS